jgi:hypothetical protein
MHGGSLPFENETGHRHTWFGGADKRGLMGISAFLRDRSEAATPVEIDKRHAVSTQQQYPRAYVANHELADATRKTDSRLSYISSWWGGILLHSR